VERVHGDLLAAVSGVRAVHHPPRGVLFAETAASGGRGAMDQRVLRRHW